MVNKIGKFLRKVHRYLTPVFVIITFWVMVSNGGMQVDSMPEKLQRVLMFTLAVTGTYLFVQFYYNKYLNYKRKKAKS